MASKWQTIPMVLPTDGQTVYIRIADYWFTPFLATCDLTNQQFISQTNSVKYPFWLVQQWSAE